MPKVCPECNEEYNDCYWKWCKPCNSTHFKNNFDKWTSRNDTIDKFIQDAQLNADDSDKVIEWIPYDKFQDIKQIAKGGYGTIYYAMWVDGNIWYWDIKNQQWKRNGQVEVVLKKFDGIVDITINEHFLNEMAILLMTRNASSLPVQFYGITKDPETHEHMMVLRYYKGGNLRNYLINNFNNINWGSKLSYLKRLAKDFAEIHKLDIVHRDFHPGNILKSNLGNHSSIFISDFGLSKLITENIKNHQKNTISGVLPYIAPEVLSGGEFTKAADVYSYAFVAYELITGLPPYYDESHDKELAFKICNGFRPKIPFHTPKLITQIIMRCWDARITHRPTFDELDKELYKYWMDYRKNNFDNNNEITIQIKEAEEFSKNQTTSGATTPTNYKTHPQAIYTSRFLDFSNSSKPKNDENFEKKLEELTESFYQINAEELGIPSSTIQIPSNKNRKSTTLVNKNITDLISSSSSSASLIQQQRQQ
ncbi:hypothetical protein Glove_212g132 [Diversispora epigaea]|uniref:Protein kinase domain-containing protein n=1 Tax=Diversispora epigaea TaxID=1348612 RepID=A0A397IHY6_9GLOM|nr:hypothetical protein Glove_212g132 [Diversispora epigaea]